MNPTTGRAGPRSPAHPGLRPLVLLTVILVQVTATVVPAEAASTRSTCSQSCVTAQGVYWDDYYSQYYVRFHNACSEGYKVTVYNGTTPYGGCVRPNGSADIYVGRTLVSEELRWCAERNAACDDPYGS